MVELHFSPREKEYINLRFVEELTLKEIAELMHIELGTVKYFGQLVIRKLGLSGNSGVSQIKAFRKLLSLGVIQLKGKQ